MKEDVLNEDLLDEDYIASLKVSELINYHDDFFESKEEEEIKIKNLIFKELQTRKGFVALFETEEMKKLIGKLCDGDKPTCMW